MNPKGELLHAAARAIHPLRQRYWRIAKPLTYGVKVAVQSPVTEQFLLVQHSYEDGKIYTFPGGGYKKEKETPEEAGEREVRQELGIVIGGIRIIGEYFSRLEGKRDTITCLYGVLEGGELNPNSEIADMLWVSNKELQDVPLNYAGREMVLYLRNSQLL